MNSKHGPIRRTCSVEGCGKEYDRRPGKPDTMCFAHRLAYMTAFNAAQHEIGDMERAIIRQEYRAAAMRVQQRLAELRRRSA